MIIYPRRRKSKLKKTTAKKTSNAKHPKNTCDKKIKNTKKKNKKIDINNADSDDIFENKVTSKVSKIRKKIQIYVEFA